MPRDPAGADRPVEDAAGTAQALGFLGCLAEIAGLVAGALVLLVQGRLTLTTPDGQDGAGDLPGIVVIGLLGVVIAAPWVLGLFAAVTWDTMVRQVATRRPSLGRLRGPGDLITAILAFGVPGLLSLWVALVAPPLAAIALGLVVLLIGYLAATVALRAGRRALVEVVARLRERNQPVQGYGPHAVDVERVLARAARLTPTEAARLAEAWTGIAPDAAVNPMRTAWRRFGWRGIVRTYLAGLRASSGGGDAVQVLRAERLEVLRGTTAREAIEIAKRLGLAAAAHRCQHEARRAVQDALRPHGWQVAEAEAAAAAAALEALVGHELDEVSAAALADPWRTALAEERS